MNVSQVVSRSDINTFNTGTCRIMKLALDQAEKVLYCGTNTGAIRVYKWPLQSTTTTSPHTAPDKHGTRCVYLLPPAVGRGLEGKHTAFDRVVAVIVVPWASPAQVTAVGPWTMARRRCRLHCRSRSTWSFRCTRQP